MQHKIENVWAKWPRINKTYKFDSQERKSVPCDKLDPAAAYEMSFEMTPEQAKELWGKMLEAYKAKADPTWPAQPSNPFKKTDIGTYLGKAKLKGNYNGEPTKGVGQYDAKGNRLADDFMLTTGSTVNIAVTLVPYNMREAGVSIRLRAVQVLELAEMEDSNPFGAVEGAAPKEDDPFGLPEVKPTPAPAPAASVDFDDEIPW